MVNHRIRAHWLSLAIVPMTLLFFMGGPNAVALPVERYAWNLGHIAFFSLATLTFISYRPIRSTRDIIGLVAAVICLSIAIESIQRFIGRDFSLHDILRNVGGTLLTLFMVARRALPYILWGLGGVILSVDAVGFSSTALLDYQQQTRAPLMDDFEDARFLRFWSSNLSLTPSPRLSGDSAGKVIFQPARFSGVTLSPILANWSDFTSLELNIHNPQLNTLRIIIRINDQQHEFSEQLHNDRYNHGFDLEPGWNRVSIPLDELRMAPKNRDMDLTKIHKLGLFFTDLTSTTELTFDDFTLR